MLAEHRTDWLNSTYGEAPVAEALAQVPHVPVDEAATGVEVAQLAVLYE